MTRNYKRQLRRENAIKTIAFLLVLWLIILALFISNQPPKVVDQISYFVGKGETLWSIVEEHGDLYGNEYDIRQVIDDIEELSDCTAEIYPGQLIKLPVYE